MKIFNNSLFKTKPLLILSAAIIPSFFCIQTIQSQQLPQRGPIPFHIYDINADGSISQDEFNTIRGLRMENRAAQGRPIKNMTSEPKFNQFDTNNDGYLNPEELAIGQQMQRQKRREFRQSQGMGMRQMQMQGMRGTHMMPKFENFDSNQDGALSPEEFTAGLQQHMQNRQNMRQNQGKSQNQSRGMNRGRNMPKFADFDANKDGYISEQELIEARSMRISGRIQQGYQMRNTANIVPFNEIDTNSDGKISAEEFSTQQKSHQGAK